MQNLPPELQFNFVNEDTNEITGEENSNLVYEEPTEEEETKPQLDLPSIEKEEINDDVIFEKANIKAVVEEPEDEKKPVGRPKKAVKLNKNGQPRKQRVYTDEQREKMRQTMINNRAKIGKNNEKKKEEKAKEETHKELMKKKRDMEIEEVQEKIVEKSKPKEQQKKNGFTKEEMKDAQLEAIMEYDALRKKRKAKKKEDKMVQQQKEDLKKLVRREMGWEETAGKYSGCY
jgi:hypothetical protein